MAALDLIVQNDDGEYSLTQIGAELGEALAPLDKWATRWAATSPP